MQNLFGSKRQYRMAYWLIWAIIAIFYAVTLILLWDFSLSVAALDALIFGGLFAAMGIAVWFLVKFSGLDTASVINTFVTHLVAASLLVFLIVTAGEALLTVLSPSAKEIYAFNGNYHIYRLAAGGLIYAFLAINFYLIFYYEEYRSKKIREVEMDRHLKSAELSMLKAQINPHFIFNGLNSISSLTLTDPNKAHEMIIQLADFLRYSIRKNADQLETLSQELEAIRLFLAIEKTRYGKRLKIEIDSSDEISSCKLPALILQPIIENAIKYSLHETDIDSSILMRCRLNSMLLITVTNTYSPDSNIKKGEGLGLNNVKQRLGHIYGRDDLLQVSSTDGDFTVNLRVPQ